MMKALDTSHDVRSEGTQLDLCDVDWMNWIALLCLNSVWPKMKKKCYQYKKTRHTVRFELATERENESAAMCYKDPELRRKWSHKNYEL